MKTALLLILLLLTSCKGTKPKTNKLVWKGDTNVAYWSVIAFENDEPTGFFIKKVYTPEVELPAESSNILVRIVAVGRNGLHSNVAFVVITNGQILK